jgi:hypothetical protein
MSEIACLVVAPLEDATAIGEARSHERWPWLDVNSLDAIDVASLHCVMDGNNPAAPVDPPEFRVNPFTKAKVTITLAHRYLEAFGFVGSHDETEALVVRLPGALVGRLAGLNAASAVELSVRWRIAVEACGYPSAVDHESAGEYLQALSSMATKALTRREELLFWALM